MQQTSRREARRLRRRVAHLEDILTEQRRVWSQEYTGGVEIGRRDFTDDFLPEIVRTARKLGHAVVVVGSDNDTLRFIALPHPDEAI